jgi:hypothetical protein
LAGSESQKINNIEMVPLMFRIEDLRSEFVALEKDRSKHAGEYSNGAAIMEVSAS